MLRVPGIKLAGHQRRMAGSAHIAAERDGEGDHFVVRELPEVPLKDEVWPKFLRENALRVLKLG